jgi:hypothetical protein
MAARIMANLLTTIPRNALLLLMLVVLLVVAPLVPEERSWFIVELVFDMILLSGVRGLDITALALTVTWLSYALAIIAAGLFRAREVTVDTIAGAIVTYLLVAVAFAMIYQIVELRSPGSISGLSDAAYDDRAELMSSLIYFSMVCITTMGYGDIVPVSNLARPLAVIEGAFGQLFLAVVIARLVGLHIANSKSD